MAFVGDGLFSGDGGASLQQLWSKWPWKPVKNEPGRYNMKRVGDGIPPVALCETAGLGKVKCVQVKPALLIIDLEGGGGLVTIKNPDGTFVHTLNTKSSLKAYREAM